MKDQRLSIVAVLLIAGSAYAQTEPSPPAPPPTGDAPAPPLAPATPAPETAPPAPAPAPRSDANAVVAPASPPRAPAPAAPPPAPGGRTPAAPLKIDTPSSSIKFGVLLQPQYEAIGSPALDSMSQNLFLRRTRVLLGGTLFGGYFEYFLDTDFPDLFKSNPSTGVRNTPGLNIQDAYFTVKAAGDLFKIDTGYMLPPLSHNAVQGATSLYGWDYFANTFRHNQVFNNDTMAPAVPANPVGRDLGIQLRGLLVNGLLEYRLGVFQGRRNGASTTDVGSRNFFRVAGRLQLNLLDPEPGFFYAGTYLGTKKILSLGVSYDFQDSYKRVSGDAFLDLPAGPGVLTAQVNVVHSDGDDWVPLLKQTAFMGEVGYLIDAANLSPIFRFEKRWVDGETAGAPDETRAGGGLAFWPHGHNFNLKAFFMHIAPTPAPHAYNAFNLQAQFFVY
jgi:hypothetical protein